MTVFYRRWKSHTKYSMQRRKIDNIIIILLLFAVIGIYLRYFQLRVAPVIINMAEDQAETAVVIMIDEAVSECSELDKISYDDIIDITYNEADEPMALSAHTVKLNKIRSELSIEMNRKLDTLTKTTVNIPFGTILGLKTLSGFGIRIPVEFVPYGTAYAEFLSAFDGYDINRTIHKVYIRATASINILVPFNTKPLTVNTDIPIVETIISGSVPESLINIDGLVNHEK